MCQCNLWPKWLAEAPEGVVTSVDWLRCYDFTHITKESGSTSACPYWKPGLDEGRQRAFFPGVVNDLFKIMNSNHTEQFVIEVNSTGLVATEGYQCVCLLDVNGPPCHRDSEDKQRDFQKWRTLQDPNNR
jgi:hypothetical protein